MGNYQYVLLDADMTLLDFRRSEREALNRTLQTHGLPQTRETVNTYAKINDALWKAMARGEVDQDFLVVERFAALLRTLHTVGDPRALNRDYAAFLGEEAWLLPGALEFCRRLRDSGLTLAIATNGLPCAQRGRYHRSGLDRVIPHLFISMELGAQKPDPVFFERILNALDVTDRARVIMVGDGLETDILGASRAGLDSAWFNPESRPLTGSVQPTCIAASYDELLDLLLDAPDDYNSVSKL